MELLKKVPLFNNLNKRQLNEISKHADETQVKAGDVMAQEGRKGWEFFFIVEGKAQVKNGRKVIRTLREGDYFGEISLIDGGPQTASVISEKDMTILVIHKTSFDHLLKTVPDLQRKILISLCMYTRKKSIDKLYGL